MCNFFLQGPTLTSAHGIVAVAHTTNTCYTLHTAETLGMEMCKLLLHIGAWLNGTLLVAFVRLVINNNLRLSGGRQGRCPVYRINHCNYCARLFSPRSNVRYYHICFRHSAIVQPMGPAILNSASQF